MPSPLGHVLAGVTVATLAARSSRPHDLRLSVDAPYTSKPRHWLLDPLVIAAAIVAAAPDLDLLVRAWHRKGTHSLVATALVMIVTMAVTGKVTGRINWRWVVVLGAAHASHLLTDWLGADPSRPAGLQILWPFTNEFYKSGLDVFPVTERNFRVMAKVIRVNLWAVFVESIVLVPAIWLARRFATRRRRSRAPISGQAVRRPPSA